MKLKYLAPPICRGCSSPFFCLPLLAAILFASDDNGGAAFIMAAQNTVCGGAGIQADERYAAQYGISEYVTVLLAIMQVESGGTPEDVMQSSESMGCPRTRWMRKALSGQGAGTCRTAR